MSVFGTDHGIIIPGLDKTTTPPASKGTDEPGIRRNEGIEIRAMGRVIVCNACATATYGDCSTSGCGNCANTKVVEDMLWGAEGDGSTVSEMERKRGTIYCGVTVRAVRARTREGAIGFRSRIIWKIIQVTQMLAKRLFGKISPERDFCRIGEVR